MSWLKRLFGMGRQPKARVRICVECGMPVGEHKSWCSILQGKMEMERAAASRSASGTTS